MSTCTALPRLEGFLLIFRDRGCRDSRLAVLGEEVRRLDPGVLGVEVEADGALARRAGPALLLLLRCVEVYVGSVGLRGVQWDPVNWE